MEKKYQENKVLNIIWIVVVHLLPILLFGLSDYLEQKNLQTIGLTIGGILLVESILLLYWIQRKECMQYWHMVLVTWLLCYICRFLSVQCWPICVLALVWCLLFEYRMATMIPAFCMGIVVLDLQLPVYVYLCYVVLGIVTLSLFDQRKEEKAFWKLEFLYGLAFLVSQGLFLYCTGYCKTEWKEICFSFATLLVTALFLYVFLYFYKRDVLNFHHTFYETYNNPEMDVLLELKAKNANAYKNCIHTAYFCDRLAGKLEVPSNPIRCAALYHEMQNYVDFPEEVKHIWEEVDGPANGYLHKESIIFICAESVVGTVLALNQKNGKKKSYEKDIDKIFDYLEKKRIGSNSDISMAEWIVIKDTFLEENLYYDFLC